MKWQKNTSSVHPFKPDVPVLRPRVSLPSTETWLGDLWQCNIHCITLRPPSSTAGRPDFQRRHTESSSNLCPGIRGQFLQPGEPAAISTTRCLWQSIIRSRRFTGNLSTFFFFSNPSFTQPSSLCYFRFVFQMLFFIFYFWRSFSHSISSLFVCLFVCFFLSSHSKLVIHCNSTPPPPPPPPQLATHCNSNPPLPLPAISIFFF